MLGTDTNKVQIGAANPLASPAAPVAVTLPTTIANRVLLCGLVIQNASGVIDSVTYGGVTLHLLDAFDFGAGGPIVQVYYLLDAELPAVSGNLVISQTPALHFASCPFFVGGVDQFAPFGARTKVQGTGVVASITVPGVKLPNKAFEFYGGAGAIAAAVSDAHPNVGASSSGTAAGTRVRHQSGYLAATGDGDLTLARAPSSSVNWVEMGFELRAAHTAGCGVVGY